MGDPRRLRKKYKRPSNPFEKDRQMEELQFVGKYGLRNKKEFWKSRSHLSQWRDIARKSRTLPKEKAAEVQRQLVVKINRMGIIGTEAQLEDVLRLTVEDVLKRRLQTVVYDKGFAKTIYHARQLITHGHIMIGEKKINAPSYFVKREDEDKIMFDPRSAYASRIEEIKAEKKQREQKMEREAERKEKRERGDRRGRGRGRGEQEEEEKAPEAE